jgi:arsenate reductase-like glutaredoxin family protein
LRNELAVELDERDYAKQPLSESELKDLFKAVDPLNYINPKSPAFKRMNLKGKTITPEQALKLMTQEPNLIKRPLTIAGRKIIAGFDRDQLRKTFD